MPYQAQQRSRSDLGRANRRDVLAQILYEGPIPRTMIAERTGLTSASVSRITRDLVNAGLVVEAPSSVPNSRPGRRFIDVSLDPEGGCVLGVSVNAFAQTVTLADLRNNVLGQRQLNLESLAVPAEVLRAVARESADLIDSSKVSRAKILGGAVAIYGAVDPISGIIQSAPGFGWDDVEVSSYLSTQLDLPIRVETISNTLNLAETRFGAARGCKNVVLINASLKLTASLLLDNHLRRGSNFSAGMIGQLRHFSQDGVFRRDSATLLDDLAGGQAVLALLGNRERSLIHNARRAAEKLLEHIEEARSEHPRATSVFRLAGTMLGQAVETTITLLQPEKVLLAGPMTTVPAYVEGVRDVLRGDGNGDDFAERLTVSEMSIENAAQLLALNEFLVARDLDLKERARGRAHRHAMARA